jgi:hypothetical protein
MSKETGLVAGSADTIRAPAGNWASGKTRVVITGRRVASAIGDEATILTPATRATAARLRRRAMGVKVVNNMDLLLRNGESDKGRLHCGVGASGILGGLERAGTHSEGVKDGSVKCAISRRGESDSTAA